MANQKELQSGNTGQEVLIASSKATSGTLAEMAADAAAIILAGTEVANQGKRWENTDDGIIYDFRQVGGVWGYYVEPNADASGNIPTVAGNSTGVSFIDANADGNTYYGSAPFGSALADAVWAVTRKNASGTVFDSAPPNSVATDPTALVYNNGVGVSV